MKKIRMCDLKFTYLSLIFSFFCASGLFCFFMWYFIVVFGTMSIRPIAYPSSMVCGLLSLIAFIITIIFYTRARKNKPNPKGIIIDGFTVIVFLPIFFLLVETIYEIMSVFIGNIDSMGITEYVKLILRD